VFHTLWDHINVYLRSVIRVDSIQRALWPMDRFGVTRDTDYLLLQEIAVFP